MPSLYWSFLLSNDVEASVLVRVDDADLGVLAGSELKEAAIDLLEVVEVVGVVVEGQDELDSVRQGSGYLTLAARTSGWSRGSGLGRRCSLHPR